MELKLTDSNLKKMFVIPIALLLIAIFFLVQSYVVNGQFFIKGVDLAGGVQITVRYQEKIDTGAFESFLSSKFKNSDIQVITTTDPSTRKQQALVISLSGNLKPEEVISAVEEFLNIKLEPTQYSSTSLGPALASSFWHQAVWAFVFAFIFMMLVVGLTYKKLAPSVAIIVSALYDITFILGAIAGLRIRLSLASFAALLMIIGYSVDTNILLTDKIIKQREGDVFDRINKALRTGLTMSTTTIASLLALVVFTNSVVLKEIGGILLIGALADIPNTWLLNANLLLRWPKK